MRLINRLDVLFLVACLAWIGLGPSAAAAEPHADSQARAAAAPTAAPTLAIGNTPPPLNPMAWVKGEPVKAFERDHVYVIAFFATWCGASRQSMPLLSDVARRHKGKLTVIGINVRESERGEASVAAVTRFVQARGRDMDYTVAMDDPASTPMFTSWMRAAGMYAIPTAFIVGRDGALAYVGIPIDPEASYGFERAVEQAVAGTSDLAAARQLQRELGEQIAYYLEDMKLTKALDEAMQRKDYRTVLVEAAKLVAQDPQREVRVFGDRLVAMLHLDEAGALAFARKTLAAAETGEASRAIEGTIGSVIAYMPGLSRDAYQMAVSRLETAIPAQGGDFNTVFDLLALAKLQQQLGHQARAIEAQQRAVDIARGRKDITAEMMVGLEKTLADYRAGGPDQSR
jgi:thiol-disulfide isomerase/thioredoxin